VRVAALVVTLLLVQGALRLGVLSALPEMLRLALAFATLVLLPGLAFVALGARPPGGAAFAPVWALGFGVAWNAILVLITRLFGLRFTVLADASLPITAFLWLAVAWRARGASPSRVRPDGLSGPALAAVLVAAGLACGHAAILKTPVSYFSDSPDHIGTIRRMLLSGDAFPLDAFFHDAGPGGADPRKGLWHPQVALIAQLARVDPADAWLKLPAAIAPLFVLNAALLGWLSSASTGAGVFAWVQLVVLAGSVTWFPLRKAVFSTFLGDQLALATAVAVLADAARPTRAGRLVAIGLGLSAIACHLYAALQFAVALGALTMGFALRDRTMRGPAWRVAGTSLLLGLASLPYLAWRVIQSGPARNIIHTEPQGLLYITDQVKVVSIGVLWDWMGLLWVLFPIAWWFLWRYGRRDPAALYALTTSLAVALIMFNPVVVTLLAPRLGYLLMRMIWMVPLTPLIGWALVELGRAARHGTRPWAARITLAALVLFLAPTARDAAATLVDPEPFVRVDREESPFRWRTAMKWLDTRVPAGQVVLSDPATSYGVPMFTRHYVVTLLDQHSSPSDSTALARLLDARDALDPYGSWDRTRQVVRRWGATLVVVNSDFATPPNLGYWEPSVEWAAEARARFDAAPAAFEPIYDRQGFKVYRIHSAALDTLSGPARPRPFVVPFVSGRFPVARRYAEDLPTILDLRLTPRSALPGDSLRGVAEWRALRPLPAGSYSVTVRFERPLPGGFEPPAPLAKPARKLLERARRERYRFRNDHLPTGGAFGVDLWRPDQVVRDSFSFQVPLDVAAGWYRVQIRMIRHPWYPNLRLSDYFFDHDYYSGVEVGTLEVKPRAGSRGSQPNPPPLEGH
jgi:hypothetical protein